MEEEWEEVKQPVRCSRCGGSTEKGARFCKYCGLNLKTGEIPLYAKAKYPRTSALAVLALILGVLGIIPVVGLAPVFFAIIFALIALRRIAGRPQMLKGSQIAVAALVMCSIGGIISAVFLLFAEVIPSRVESRIRGNEETALAALREISDAEKEFRMMGIVDQDRDGSGEHGFLQELAGTARPRGSTSRILEQFLAKELGQASGNGVVLYKGYNYLMYLPSVTGPTALAESRPLPLPDEADADVQEKRFICFAWPQEYNVTGKRRFFITEKGTIYCSSGFVAGNPLYDERGIPPASAPMVRGAPESQYRELSASVADLSRDEASVDGAVWEPLIR